jgi:hypothetical protein
MARSFQVTFDATDPARLADFWAEALGYVIPTPPDGFATWDEWARGMEIPEEKWNDARALVDGDGVGPRLFFQRVPEGKSAKNRVHLDVNVGGDITDPDDRKASVEAEALRLAGLGATRSAEHRGLVGEHWIVMLDPEGNELCLQ